MLEITTYTIRLLDQEPDTIAICPDHPDYIVLGTYSLLSDIKTPESSAESSRIGSLQILPFSEHSDPSPHEVNPATGVETSNPGRVDFDDCGVYAIQFHHEYTTLLGVATSAARIDFFWLDTVANEAEATVHGLRLRCAGSVLVEDLIENDSNVAIITHFHFVDVSPQHSSFLSSTTSDQPRVNLVATTQFGNTKLLSVSIPRALAGVTQRLVYLNSQIVQIHQQSYNLEAWCALTLRVDSYTPESHELLVFSGGDDSQLLISRLAKDNTHDTDSGGIGFTSTIVHRDRRTHEAGLVHVTSLGLLPNQTDLQVDSTTGSPAQPPAYLIATGSYDHSLRLFLIDTSICRPVLLDSLSFPSGVWRVTLLATYYLSSIGRWQYVLLVAGHTAGCFIARLQLWYDSEHEVQTEMHVEASFTKGHDSVVYAAVAQQEELGSWSVVSSSFYDRKVCNWRWTDRLRSAKW